MNIKHLLVFISLVVAISCCLLADPVFGQKKNGDKGEEDKDELTSASIPEEEMESYRKQASQIVKFLESTLNFLADKSNTVKEKETIINESYSKFFWDDEVQVEDDLDEKRLVPLYKDVQAYLTDVDFFFKEAKFGYQVQDVNVMSTSAGKTFFKVTANRSLKGLTVDGDSVNSNMVRYIEINYDENKKQIKIVSIYTTKLNEKEDLRNWWNGLSQEWREILGKDLKVAPGLMLSNVENYNDTVAIVDSMPILIQDSRIYGLFLKIVDSKSIDLSGNLMVSKLEPLAKLSHLTTINLSKTPVSDLMPLRNLNALENLDISGTQVSSLNPLKYCNYIRELQLSNTGITEISIVSSFPGLEVLDISDTDVSDLEPLAELTNLRTLLINNTPVRDLGPIRDMKKLQILNFSNTQVTDIKPLEYLEALQAVTFNQTDVNTLKPLTDLPALERIYCDQTKIRKDNAVQFMIDHPGVVVSFAPTQLERWWESMSPEWQKIFYIYRKLDSKPTLEQLHSLMTIDSLNISGRSEIKSLSPLTELPRLRWLDCSLTPLSSLDPLNNLLDLSYLNAKSTGITSVGPLAALAKLSFLNLDNTKVTDISPLTRLTKMELILADNSGVTKVEANEFMVKNSGCLVISQTYENSNWWKALPDPWKDIFKKKLKITKDPDKYQLQEIASLNSLSIKDNPRINSVQPVLFLSLLTEFRFSDTRVTSLDPLSRMKWLKRLGFPKNAISDLAPLSNLRGLIELDFENTQVEKLRSIENLTNMEVLKLSGTPVKNLKYISRMTKLQVVELYNTRINKIDELNNMKNLKSIKIFNTRVSSKRVDRFKMLHPGCKVDYY